MSGCGSFFGFGSGFDKIGLGVSGGGFGGFLGGGSSFGFGFGGSSGGKFDLGSFGFGSGYLFSHLPKLIRSLC